MEDKVVSAESRFPFWLFNYIKPFKLILVVCVFTMLINSGVTSYIAYFIKDIINTVLVTKDERMMKLIPFILFVLIVIKGVAFFTNYYLMAYVGQRAVAFLREDLYYRILKTPLDVFLKEPPGSFISKVLNDTALLQDFMARQIATVSRNFLTAVALIGVVFYQDFKLAAFGFVALPLIGFLISRIGKRIKAYTHRMQEHLATVTDHLFEGVKNIREIKLFTIEDKMAESFRKDNAEYVRQFMKIKKIEGLYPPVVETVAVLMAGMLVLYGGQRIIEGSLSPGTLFSFLVAMVMAYEPVRKIGQDYNKIQQSVSVAERIKTILHGEDEYKLRDGSVVLDSDIKELAFHNVGFTYPSSGKPALKDVSLTFECGRKYAIVGRTGSGKTTLVSLIPRFYDPTHGYITINGVDIKDYTLRSLRKRIGYVSQEIILFRGSIMENILIGKADATESEVVEAARIANIHAFVESLPRGYHTVIGEGGIDLSGGQKQRISIARAVLRRPDVLILDEATSALDSETEKAVQMAIDRAFSDKIIITIAHRLSTVVSSDMIIFVEDGVVTGLGKHEELLEKNERYRNICRLQFEEL